LQATCDGRADPKKKKKGETFGGGGEREKKGILYACLAKRRKKKGEGARKSEKKKKVGPTGLVPPAQIKEKKPRSEKEIMRKKKGRETASEKRRRQKGKESGKLNKTPKKGETPMWGERRTRREEPRSCWQRSLKERRKKREEKPEIPIMSGERKKGNPQDALSKTVEVLKEKKGEGEAFKKKRGGKRMLQQGRTSEFQKKPELPEEEGRKPPPALGAGDHADVK